MTPGPIGFRAASAADCADLVARARDNVAPLPGRSSTQGWYWGLAEPHPAAESAMAGLAWINTDRFHFAVEVIRCAVLRYRPGQYMKRHTDLYHPDGEVRLLSASVQLSAGSDYTGGDLRLGEDLDLFAPREVGAAVAFPASVPHMVEPVVIGTRWSLVLWGYGR